MTTNYHTPPVDGAPANMSVIRAPLAELDQAISDLALTEKDGHIIQDEGTDVAQQQRLNFVGTGVTVTNDAGNSATIVTIEQSNATTHYKLSVTVASFNLTVALKLMDDSDPSPTYPLLVRVGNEEMEITSALSVTVTAAMADIFTFDAGKIQGYDCQLFVYLINNNGTPQLGVSPNPKLQTVATVYRDAVGQTGSVTQNNIVMSGTRNATNTCANIGRINASQLDSNNWQNPIVNNVVNEPIYGTDWLQYLPASYTGFSSAPPNPVYYQYAEGKCKLRTNGIGTGTSNLSSFSMIAPFVAADIISAHMPILIYDNGAFVSQPGWAVMTKNTRTVNFYKATSGVDNFTTSGAKTAWGEIEFFLFQ